MNVEQATPGTEQGSKDAADKKTEMKSKMKLKMKMKMKMKVEMLKLKRKRRKPADAKTCKRKCRRIGQRLRASDNIYRRPH